MTTSQHPFRQLRYPTSPEATFDEDLVRSYRSFLDNSRSLEVQGVEASREAAARKLVSLDQMLKRQQPAGTVNLGISVIADSVPDRRVPPS